MMIKKICLGVIVACLLGLSGQASAVIGAMDNVPAATLLLPYFEVDLNSGNGVNTLFSINNAAAEAVLAHVTVWSDQSIPVLDFDVYLTGFDVQTISLRNVFEAGNLPLTASAGQDPKGADLGVGRSPRGVLSQDIDFPGCNGTLEYKNPALNDQFLDHLKAVLQGKASPTFGTCYGSKTQDNILRGYVTVDTVNTCNVLFPSQWPLYGTVITHQNVLWGDYFYVNDAQNFAQSETLVHIESCPTCFPVPEGQHTFYGRYNGATAIDGREPLPTTMAIRYLIGGGFNGGTDFLIWREGGDEVSATSYNCSFGGPPQWYPLEFAQILIWDETEQLVVTENCPSGFDCEEDILIPNEAQRADAANLLSTPYSAGVVFFNLQWPPGLTLPAYNDPFAQMWLTAVMDATGRFSVGHDAVNLDDANHPYITIPLP